MQPTLLGLIDRLVALGCPKLNGAEAPAPSREPMPAWMRNLHAKMVSADAHANVRMFIAKLVCNRHRAFQAFATEWFRSVSPHCPGSAHIAARPLMQMVLHFDQPNCAGIHYFITDICVVLLTWHATAVPDASDSFLAGRMLRFLFAQARHVSGSVMRNNINIIKAFVEHWKFDASATLSHRHVIMQAADFERDSYQGDIRQLCRRRPPFQVEPDRPAHAERG